MIGRKLIFAASLVSAAPVAARIPEPVREMIDAAIAAGDAQTVEAVIRIAKTTNPDDAQALDAMLGAFEAGQREQAELAAAREARAAEIAVRSAGLFDNWSGEGQIGAFQSSGNTQSVGVSAALKLQREGVEWTHKLRASADYQRTNGTTSREQFLLAYEPRYALSERMFVYGLSQFERDRFQGYSSRYSLSGGFGYKVIDGDNINLSIKAGPAYRRTEFADGSSASNIAAMFGADFDWQLADTIKLTSDTNATTEGDSEALVFINSDNISLSVITGLEAKLNNDLSARLSYAVEYDSNPPAGAVNTDSLTRFTLVYGF